MKTYLIQPLAHALICVLWCLGDYLFDRFVAPGTGKRWRGETLFRWTKRQEALDAYEPKTERQKVWLVNKRNLLRETGEYMKFEPYVPLAERAARMAHAGGEHQP